jgi:hypothetical protein
MGLGFGRESSSSTVQFGVTHAVVPCRLFSQNDIRLQGILISNVGRKKDSPGVFGASHNPSTQMSGVTSSNRLRTFCFLSNSTSALLLFYVV